MRRPDLSQELGEPSPADVPRPFLHLVIGHVVEEVARAGDHATEELRQPGRAALAEAGGPALGGDEEVGLVEVAELRQEITAGIEQRLGDLARGLRVERVGVDEHAERGLDEGLLRGGVVLDAGREISQRRLHLGREHAVERVNLCGEIVRLVAEGRGAAGDLVGLGELLARPENGDDADLAVGVGPTLTCDRVADHLEPIAVERPRLVHVVVPTVAEHEQVGERLVTDEGDGGVALLRLRDRALLLELDRCHGEAFDHLGHNCHS